MRLIRVCSFLPRGVRGGCCWLLAGWLDANVWWGQEGASALLQTLRRALM